MTVPSLSLGGLAAPFDVNALIDQVMDAESIPLQNLQAARQGYQNKDAAWSGIVTRVSALRSAVDALSLAENMIASSSNPTAVSASVTGTPNPSSLTFDVVQLARAHTEHSADTVTSPDATVGVGNFSMNVGGTDYSTTLDGSETITELAATINGWDSGVTASVLKVDTDEYSLVLVADETGDDSQFSVTSLVVGFTDFDTSIEGQDAEIKIGDGGDALTIQRSTNSFSDVIDGVTFELHAVADDVTVTTSRDFDGSGDGIADVVTKLNSVLSHLATLTNYDATTGTAGVLAGDSTARALATSLRAAVSGAVGADPTTYVGASIGISLTRTGTFTIDQAAFEEALANDFDGVSAFIDDVVLANLDTELDATEGVGGSIARARDRWQNQIDFMDDRIEAFEDRLDRKEAALIRQFSALEVALQNLYSQSQWLTNQVAGLNGSA